MQRVHEHVQQELADQKKLDNEFWVFDGTNIRATRAAAGGGKIVTANPPITR